MGSGKNHQLAETMDADAIARRLSEFSVSAHALSSEKADILDRYDHKWIALYEGDIEIVCDTLEELKAAAQERQLPLTDMLVKFISRDENNYILPSAGD